MPDDDGLRQLCEGTYPQLVGALRLYLRDEHLAEDITQEALVRLCQHWPRVRNYERPSSWVYRVAFNLATSALRRGQIERRALRRLASMHDDVVEGPSADLDLRHALTTLSPRRRQAVILRFLLGCSVRECADVMKCAEGTIRALTSQALDGLRASLNQGVQQ